MSLFERIADLSESKLMLRPQDGAAGGMTPAGEKKLSANIKSIEKARKALMDAMKGAQWIKNRYFDDAMVNANTRVDKAMHQLHRLDGTV